jgi:molybdate transport system ATP-binding protein
MGPSTELRTGQRTGLRAEVLVSRGDFTLDVTLEVGAGETLALLGPNGSGKSTLLQAIAGILPLHRGFVTVRERTLSATGGRGPRVAVAPHERKIGLLGQDPLLFPHLSALDNVAFGPRSQGDTAARARTKAAQWLEAVGVGELSSRRPTQLSGGQQQRVAIARALAVEPDVLLLDEPMAALDVHNAAAVRTLLRERLGATAMATVVVTHDVVDALVLADRVAILDGGRIVDSGQAATVLNMPRSRFAASLVGVNLLEGTLSADGSVLCSDGRRVRGGTIDVDGLREGDRVSAAFPPTAVRMSAAGGVDASVAAGTGDTSWRAVVGSFEHAVRGIRVPFLRDTVVAEVTAAELMSSGIREGDAVVVTVDPQFVTVYPTTAVVGVLGE